MNEFNSSEDDIEEGIQYKNPQNMILEEEKEETFESEFEFYDPDPEYYHSI